MAQAITPQGAVWYVAQARSHHGFVVQRRYRGVGTPFYRKHYPYPSDLWAGYQYAEAYLEPFLNPSAVQAAGLCATTIRQWAAAHPDEIFTHPTYASLCLRWGENAHGYRVEEFREPALTPDTLPFTPHTCWESGTTYYQWAAGPNVEIDLWERIRVPARLQNHLREIGREGRWSGWYTTDYRALDQALATQGRRLALAQPRMGYGVFTQEGGELEVLMTADTAEEAQAYFAALPAVPFTYHCPPVGGTFTCLGSWVQWPGQVPEWLNLGEKYVVLVPEHKEFLLQSCAASALPLTRTYVGELSEQDMPLSVPLVTLAAVLATAGLVRWQLAEALGWSMEELSEREQNPGGLTLADVERIGALTQRPVEHLLMQLREEMRARASGKRGHCSSQRAGLRSGKECLNTGVGSCFSSSYPGNGLRGVGTTEHSLRSSVLI
jgi:hypothetical protein